MPTPRRDSRFLEALPKKGGTDSSTLTSTSSTSSTTATSSSSNLSTKNPIATHPSQAKNRLKLKLHDMIFGVPPALSSEGWVLRPDLLFEMQKAVGKNGDDVRRDLAREMAGRDAADGKGGKEGGRGKQGKRPTSAADVEALMLRGVE